MKPFLYQIASLFYDTFGADVSRYAFVFPNRRAGLFFQKHLSEISDKPLFSPAIFTINDLFLTLSGKQVADRISMLFSLYTIYIERSKETETFDEFIYWGEMLLNDFDDVDKYMVDARMLFTNVTDLREIEKDFNFLSETQIAAIRSFWASFYPKNDSGNQQHFLALWKIFYELYVELKKTLLEENKGYEGMIFREVVETIEKNGIKELPYQKIVFVGLNALSLVEEKLLLELKRNGIADFYWDYASTKVTDKNNKTSYFAERNKQLFPSCLPFEETAPPETEIEVIGIPSAIGQAKQVYTLLNELCTTTDFTEEEALQTAVVLADEHLLIPVLNAIPEQIQHINVTMGYPLGGTPVASLMEHILALQKNVRYVDRRPMFYFRDVLQILGHQYIAASNPEVISRLVKHITEFNKVTIDQAELNQTPLLAIIFTPVDDVSQLPAYLIKVLEELNKQMTTVTTTDMADEEKQTFSSKDIEQEFIFHYFTTVNRMTEMMRKAQVDMKIDTYFRLLKRITDTITIPFRGEPLSGLQIMGVLETRALDFERVIILSMNEGIFPQKKAANSFIPYNLRRGFGLPTYEHQDSVWAYHFYRLIYRAKKVSLLYDTRNNGLQTGEKSRFIHQLHYHYEEPMHEKLVVYNVSSSKAFPIQIEKTDKVMEHLAVFRKGGKKAISASAINTYLDCPLKFYFSVVEGIEEEEEISETIGSDVFGSILHKVMEELYEPLRGKLVTADLLQIIRKDKDSITQSITCAFTELFFKTGTIRPLTGQNFLIGEMIRKYVERILEQDSKLTPFCYLESEKRMKDLFSLSDGSGIQLKGFIDRIDKVGDTIRIIDYKSGKGLQHFSTLESLFSIEEKERPKAIMQVFMYAWMYSRLPENNGKNVRPGIYYMRTIFANDFDVNIYHRIGAREKEIVDRFSDYTEEFEAKMRACLDEIFGMDTPFVQTPTGKTCVYCPFKNICGK
ncbi:MAG: PD-(D/E)XK nuclease family protein [Tannerellaceae bacterium]|jgi:CRISPR/Cas system-associated exonuclease Cas4 (RecB family)|nr:PD-(D/E)XK nuclease family protein [Tannerellaceae bacterium]